MEALAQIGRVLIVSFGAVGGLFMILLGLLMVSTVVFVIAFIAWHIWPPLVFIGGFIVICIGAAFVQAVRNA